MARAHIWVGVCMEERTARWEERSAGVTAASVSAWISVQIQSSREVSSYYRWAREAENPGRHPQKAGITHDQHLAPFRNPLYPDEK